MSLLNQFKIGPRLIFSFGIILLLLISISLTSILRINTISDTTKMFLERDVNRVTAASRINAEAQNAAIILLELLTSSERDERIKLYPLSTRRTKISMLLSLN